MNYYVVLIAAFLVLFQVVSFPLHNFGMLCVVRKFTDESIWNELNLTPDGAEVHIKALYSKVTYQMMPVTVIIWLGVLTGLLLIDEDLYILAMPVLFFQFANPVFDRACYIYFTLKVIKKREKPGVWIYLKSSLISLIRTMLIFSGMIVTELLLIILCLVIVEGYFIHQKKYFEKFIEAYKKPMV